MNKTKEQLLKEIEKLDENIKSERTKDIFVFSQIDSNYSLFRNTETGDQVTFKSDTVQTIASENSIIVLPQFDISFDTLSILYRASKSEDKDIFLCETTDDGYISFKSVKARNEISLINKSNSTLVKCIIIADEEDIKHIDHSLLSSICEIESDKSKKLILE